MSATCSLLFPTVQCCSLLCTFVLRCALCECTAPILYAGMFPTTTHITLKKTRISVIYNTRTIRVQSHTATQHNTTQHNTMIRIFSILAVCLVVLLLSAQVRKYEVKVTQRKKLGTDLPADALRYANNSVFF